MLYKQWSGTRGTCITCFRVLAETVSHQQGICPLACREAYADGKAPESALTAAAAAKIYNARAAEPPAPPLPTPPAADGDPPPPATRAPRSGGAVMHFRVNGDAPPLPAHDAPTPAALAAESFGWTAGEFADSGLADEDFEFPAFRSDPPKMPWPIPTKGKVAD